MTVAIGWSSHVFGQPQSPIPAHQSTYTVYYNGNKVGNIHFLLEQANETVWYVKTQTQATSTLAKLLAGEVTESSHFVWQDNAGHLRVVPLTYHQVSQEPLKTRFWTHRYDWQTMTTQTSTHDGEQTIALVDGLIDPLTLRLQLAAELIQDIGLREDKTFTVLDRDDVEAQRMNYLGSTNIVVDAGCFTTEHYYRFRKEGSSRNYDLWVAPNFYWLPVKMVQQDEGRTIEIELSASDLFDSSAVCLN